VVAHEILERTFCPVIGNGDLAMYFSVRIDISRFLADIPIPVPDYRAGEVAERINEGPIPMIADLMDDYVYRVVRETKKIE